LQYAIAYLLQEAFMHIFILIYLSFFHICYAFDSQWPM